MNPDAEEILAELFRYDESLPLDAIVRDAPDDSGESSGGASSESRQYHVTFTSVHDQRVPALLALPPNATPPFPIILMLHGVLGHKSSYNQVKRSAFLTAAGYAVLRIDGQYRGEREISLGEGTGVQTPYYYRNRDAIIQTAIDLMRTMDYLATRDDIDMDKAGFAGFSMGGAVGALFCAYEPRVKAVLLAITGGDFRKLKMRAENERDQERLRQAYKIVDPVLYVGGVAPRPLLMINAAHDEIVPRAATESLFEAAKQPKRIVWYDCGHTDLPDEYMEEMKKFFDTEL